MSCKKGQENNDLSFPITENIEWTTLNSELLLSSAFDLSVDNNTIYVLSKADGKWVHTYDRSTGDYITSCINHGQGPGELINGDRFLMTFSPDETAVFDLQQQKAFTYHINRDSCALVSESKLPPNGFFASTCLTVHDGLHIIERRDSADSAMGRHFRLISETEELHSYHKIPVDEGQIMALFNNASFDVAPSGNKFVACTLFGAIIEMFAVSDSIKCINTNILIEPTVDSRNGNVRSSSFKYGFGDVCSTDSTIYASYGGTENPNEIKSLSLWDWKGNAIARLQGDELILKIAISPEKPRRVYALTYDENIGIMLKYCDIPQSIQLR